MAKNILNVVSKCEGDSAVCNTQLTIPSFSSHDEVVAEFVHRIQVAMVFTIQDVSRFFCEDDRTNLDSLLYCLCELIDEQE